MSDTEYSIITEWRSKYPHEQWYEWQLYTDGNLSLHSIVTEMQAQVQRVGGPDQAIYHTKWGDMENEVRVRVVKSPDSLTVTQAEWHKYLIEKMLHDADETLIQIKEKL